MDLNLQCCPHTLHQVLQEPSLISAQQQQTVAGDKSGRHVRQLLEPAFITVPAAVDIPALFQSALHLSGTLPFPVPDVFYESHRLQNKDMEFYLAPVSKSGAITFSSAIHAVLCKQLPAGTETVQAGQFEQLVCESWNSWTNTLETTVAPLRVRRTPNGTHPVRAPAPGKSE
ncbi:hypothetical protein ABBQ32_000661 [Trebouxia sp. C0010 RCD-2024]